MSCDITKGRKLPCKDSRIGIKYVDFALYSEYGFVVSAQEVATLSTGLDEVFRYEVKGTGNKLSEVATVDAEKRTTEIKQTLDLILPKLSKESEVELLSLVYGRVVAFVHDFNGNVVVCGIDNGLDATTASKGTDESGYKITLEAMESKYSPFLSSSAKTALTALVSTTNVTP
jgi:hypothetical protein